MERLVLPGTIRDELVKRAITESDVRVQQGVPVQWRLSPACDVFYNPAGMTQAELDAYDAAQLAVLATQRSLDPDILAMLATIIRGRNVAAWNALTTAQKKQDVRDEATVVKGMREFFDKGA